jgi:hypothetical protein
MAQLTGHAPVVHPTHPQFARVLHTKEKLKQRVAGNA